MSLRSRDRGGRKVATRHIVAAGADSKKREGVFGKEHAHSKKKQSRISGVMVAEVRSGRKCQERLRLVRACKAGIRRGINKKNPPVATMATGGLVISSFDQAAFDFATCVAIASIKAGDRQS